MSTNKSFHLQAQGNPLVGYGERISGDRTKGRQFGKSGLHTFFSLKLILTFQCVEQFYDIPRSHQPGQYAGSSMHLSEADLLSPLSQCDLVASSTPNLMMSEAGSQCGTLGRTRPHCYSNAAPQRIEGNVFRFDFSEQVNA